MMPDPIPPSVPGGSAVTRLHDLEQLQDGWDGPGSKAIPAKVFAAYANLATEFNAAVPDDLEPRAGYDGSICLEWHRGTLSFYATLEAEGGLYLYRIGRLEEHDVERFYEVFDAGVLKRFYDTGRIELPNEVVKLGS